MKRFLLLIAALLVMATTKAQVYDGITQPTKYRVWLSLSQPYDGGSATFNPFVGYRMDVAKWFNVTGVAQYNFNTQAFSPAIWLNFNIADRFYILSRNIYDWKTNKYRQTLSGTVKLPLGFMVDATWENLFNGDRFCDGDRLQVVGGYAYRWLVFNVGYSMRAMPGVIANVRFKLTPELWFQLKYDGGMETIGVNIAYNFN